MERANAEFPPFPEYTVNTGAGAHGVLLHRRRDRCTGRRNPAPGATRAARRARDRRALPRSRRPLDAGACSTTSRRRSPRCRRGRGGSRNRPYARRRNMQIKTYVDRSTMSLRGGAARGAGPSRGDRRAARGRAIVAATGASQFEFLDALTAAPGIDWSRVEMFHLDEYVGLPIDHPGQLPQVPARAADQQDRASRAYHLLDGERDAAAVADARRTRDLRRAPIDVAFVGIGENGHLAFNDPPADFDDRATLPDRHARRAPAAGSRSARAGSRRSTTCRRRRCRCRCARSSKSREIICVVPDARKARGGQGLPRGRRSSPMAPASILQTHANATVYLDRESAALLRRRRRAATILDGRRRS